MTTPAPSPSPADTSSLPPGITVYNSELRPIVTTTWFLTGINPSDHRVYLAIGNPPHSIWVLFDSDRVIDDVIAALTNLRGK